MKATNFDVRITKEQAIYLLRNDCLTAGTSIMCKEYGDDADWVGLFKEDIDTIQGAEYKTFELWNVENQANFDKWKQEEYSGNDTIIMAGAK